MVPTLKKRPVNPFREPDLSDDDFKALLASLEDSQVRHNRKKFLPGRAPSILMQPKPNINCLGPFYRRLVLRKEAFPDDKDYFASIKAMRQIEKAFGLLLQPYVVASLVATKKPGRMHEFAAAMEKDLGQLLAVDPEDLPLLVHENMLHQFSYTKPLAAGPPFSELPVKMRRWNNDRMPLRTLLLLAHLFRIGGYAPFVEWMEYPNLVLGGDSPLDQLAKGKWLEVGNLADRMLCGEPTESKTSDDEDSAT